MFEVTKDTIITDIIEYDPDTAVFFLELGMHCVSCFMAMGETVEQACEVHGMDCDSLISILNDYFLQKEAEKQIDEEKREDKETK